VAAYESRRFIRERVREKNRKIKDWDKKLKWKIK